MSVNLRPSSARVAGFTVLAFFSVPLFAAAPAPASSPWDTTALNLLKEAHADFAALPESDRDARFGEAVTLLNLQPKTDANLDRAAALFNALIAADATDHLGISARYFLARIPQVHRVNPDTAAALALFRELAALDSPHPLAQRAVIQVALLELFEPGVTADEARVRFDRLVARGASLTDPSAVRDFNLVMGDAALRFGFPDEVALGHLIAADRAGIARAATRRDTWVRIAELARRAHRPDIAADYYNRFLKNFPRDARRLLVEQHLASLPPFGRVPARSVPALSSR